MGDGDEDQEFDCIDCLARAEEAAENAMFGWAGVVDYYREFRASCPDGQRSSG